MGENARHAERGQQLERLVLSLVGQRIERHVERDIEGVLTSRRCRTGRGAQPVERGVVDREAARIARARQVAGRDRNLPGRGVGLRIARGETAQDDAIDTQVERHRDIGLHGLQLIQVVAEISTAGPHHAHHARALGVRRLACFPDDARRRGRPPDGEVVAELDALGARRQGGPDVRQVLGAELAQNGHGDLDIVHGRSFRLLESRKGDRHRIEAHAVGPRRSSRARRGRPLRAGPPKNAAHPPLRRTGAEATGG